MLGIRRACLDIPSHAFELFDEGRSTRPLACVEHQVVKTRLLSFFLIDLVRTGCGSVFI
jgi:hypothetical protein